MSLCSQCFFFFKQKTAYEMRISDWSSDVCSSDLRAAALNLVAVHVDRMDRVADLDPARLHAAREHAAEEIVAVEQRREEAERAGRVEPGRGDVARSEGRRGGKECVRTCRSRWSP